MARTVLVWKLKEKMRFTRTILAGFSGFVFKTKWYNLRAARGRSKFCGAGRSTIILFQPIMLWWTLRNRKAWRLRTSEWRILEFIQRFESFIACTAPWISARNISDLTTRDKKWEEKELIFKVKENLMSHIWTHQLQRFDDARKENKKKLRAKNWKA